MLIVAISLVRNEDRFVRRAISNVAASCDRIFAVDHMSNDATYEILCELARELDHLEVHRMTHSAESHSLIESFAGTDTWVLSVDGDELYDPGGLASLRRELEGGAYCDVFRLRPAGLHCDDLDDARRLARGYLSPPSRPLVGLFNFAAIDSWSEVPRERLHGGRIRFRVGYDMNSWRHLGAELGWEKNPFRALHVCFLPRSSADSGVVQGAGRPNLAETGASRRDALGPLERLARRVLGRDSAAASKTSDWKVAKYRRGHHVTVDASPFFVT